MESASLRVRKRVKVVYMGRPRSGLGVMPEEIWLNLERLERMIQDGIDMARSANNVTLAGQGEVLKTELFRVRSAAISGSAYPQLNEQVSQDIGALYGRVLPWRDRVNRLTIPGTEEQKRLDRESRFTYQAAQTIGRFAESGPVRSVGEFLGSSWGVPVVAGLALLFLFRR